MNFEVGLGGAFIAGLLSFISPCVLPIVPPYLCYLAGVSIAEFEDAERPAAASWRIVASAIAFVIGFSIIFVSFGASATFLGQVVQSYMRWLTVIAGILIIIMGLHFLGVFRIGLLYREARLDVPRKPPGLPGAFVMGLAFAFGWTPCVGPVLAAILFTAGAQENVGEGVKLLSAYSLGMGLPFILAAAFAGPFMRLMPRLRQRMGVVEKAMGGLLVLTGILFLTGSMNTIAFWMLEAWPSLGRVG
ncbi:MAG: cytochrome c biogenesis protein CcdA [Rhizobiales bacterium]|nr:cytochrome c biogenesis protein CcdA [Hyphomicrobiales bacterium]